MNIKEQIADCKKKLLSLDLEKERTLSHISYLQKMCDHSDKQSWTNNDGEGRFTVERCRICGLQKDGGI